MKTKLLCSVAAVALLGMSAGAAQAFDNVDWSWTKEKNQYVDIYHWQWSYFHPDGETEVEKLQIYVGNVYADAYLKGDYVPQALSAEGGTVTVNAELDFSGTVTYHDEEYGDVTGPTDPDLPLGFDTGTAENLEFGGDVDAATVFGGVNENNDEVGFTVDVSGTVSGPVEVELPDLELDDLTQDAVEGLGHALQNASAVGVVDTIYSEVPVYAHETQILIGADSIDSGDFNTLGGEGGSHVIHTIASFLVDWLDLADVSATAQAGDLHFSRRGVYYNPVEIAVDQDVSAVAEMLSIELAAFEEPAVIQTNNTPGTGDLLIDTRDTIDNSDTCDECDGVKALGVFYPVNTNMILEADITQFAYANTSASAVIYQDLTNFTNLGSYARLTDADGIGIPGLVARQNVTAAGIVSNLENKIKVPEAP